VASEPSLRTLWLEGFHHEEREEMQDKRQKLKIPNNKGQESSHQISPLRSGRNDTGYLNQSKSVLMLESVIKMERP